MSELFHLYGVSDSDVLGSTQRAKRLGSMESTRIKNQANSHGIIATRNRLTTRTTAPCSSHRIVTSTSHDLINVCQLSCEVAASGGDRKALFLCFEQQTVGLGLTRANMSYPVVGDVCPAFSRRRKTGRRAHGNMVIFSTPNSFRIHELLGTLS